MKDRHGIPATPSYELEYPGRVVFGCGSIARLPEMLPSKSGVLLATGNSAVRSGLKDEIVSLLKDHEVFCVSGIAPEPPLEDVDRLIEAGRKYHADAVVAVGGGSVIDAAKAAAAIIPLHGLCSDYFSGEERIPGKGLPFIAAPTTAGTGAEITKNSVLTDALSKIKKSLRHPSMTPDVAIVDPLLTLSCPPALTAASGLDAFIQAVESYTCPKASAPTKALASEAVRKILANLEAAFKSPSDVAARAGMAEASLLSALSFSQTGLGAIHGIAHPVGSLLGVPHGVACSVIMPHVLDWNLPACESEYASLAATCGLSCAGELLAAAAKLSSALQIPPTFSGYGLSRRHFAFIVKNCRSASMSLNPRQMTDQDVADLLSKLL